MTREYDRSKERESGVKESRRFARILLSRTPRRLFFMPVFLSPPSFLLELLLALSPFLFTKIDSSCSAELPGCALVTAVEQPSRLFSRNRSPVSGEVSSFEAGGNDAATSNATTRYCGATHATAVLHECNELANNPMQ